MGFAPHPANRYAAPADLTAGVRPEDLVYFQLNVGDADTALLVLPEDARGIRDLVVVDVAGKKNKLPELIDVLDAPELARPLIGEGTRVRLLIASHPHADHVEAVPYFLESAASLIVDDGEIWDPAYYHTNDAWHQMMQWLESHPTCGRLHPTAGTRKHIGSASFTALAPAAVLRQNFDTRGVHINNASITTLVEFPLRPAFIPIENAPPGDPKWEIGAQPQPSKRRRLLLGADAQAPSWAHVEVDFPPQVADHSTPHRLLGQADGENPLRADVFKISHHASKNGVNLELVGRVNPLISIVSCSATSDHGFPHEVALDQIREALQPLAGHSGSAKHLSDLTLGILSTSDKVEGGGVLGSIALVIPPAGDTMQIWRLGDKPSDLLTSASLGGARMLTPTPTKGDRKQ